MIVDDLWVANNKIMELSKSIDEKIRELTLGMGDNPAETLNRIGEDMGDIENLASGFEGKVRDYIRNYKN